MKHFPWAAGKSVFLAVWLISPTAHAALLDLSKAVVLTPAEATPLERQAARFLIEEVEKRTQIRWEQGVSTRANSGPAVMVGSVGALSQRTERGVAALLPSEEKRPGEGFTLRAVPDAAAPLVVVAGNDPRGVMFGVGRLLRELHLMRGRILVDQDLELSTAPAYPLRGHQLGYRPKTNSYDAWDIATWEQYFRDLIIFGCNAVELIPPRSDDAGDSPHFPRPPLQMMREMSALADRYGLDVWVWYPALDKDYSDPGTVAFALREWAEVFKALPRIDAVFVPGGDPGHTAPKPLLALLERQTRQLRESHPRAQMWLSPQGFDQSWMDEFLNFVQDTQPDWLSGIVFGPQVRLPLPKLRAALPARYPIRHYPDITHSRQCQYPVPDWDVAYALTEARECINPRPVDQAAIFRATSSSTIGFITYSEGCNDDVNKTVWSALGWDPDANVPGTLRQYGRYFIGEEMGDDFAEGLLALERNWRGSLLPNPAVETTLQQFQAMEQKAAPNQKRNWRFQQALFRAYYDAYTRRRLLHESDLERRALERLSLASSTGTAAAIAEAESILRDDSRSAVAPQWRERILELGAALFQSIGMQLSVAKYQAIGVDRGAALDTLNYPLNNGPWLEEQFVRIRALPKENERLQALRALVEWENPGPGGFYDDLGNPGRQPHLVRGPGLDRDPGCFDSARAGFEEDPIDRMLDPMAPRMRRVSWCDHAEALYDGSVRVRYENLVPGTSYHVRVVYAGDTARRRIRLMAGAGIEVHPLLQRPVPIRPMEFDIPAEAIKDGVLTLTWSGEPGVGGNGRGCQISEVWLLKERAPGQLEKQ